MPTSMTPREPCPITDVLHLQLGLTFLINLFTHHEENNMGATTCITIHLGGALSPIREFHEIVLFNFDYNFL